MHWLHQLVQLPDSDLHRIIKHFGIDPARFARDLTEALDRLQPTAASHDRVMVLEVMGRDAGHIALSAGIAEAGL